MKKTNYKSTIAGAFSALGVFLFGAPVVMNAASFEVPKPLTLWCMTAGFVLQGIGIFFAALFSADAKSVAALSERVDNTAKAVVSGDTSFLDKPK